MTRCLPLFAVCAVAAAFSAPLLADDDKPKAGVEPAKAKVGKFRVSGSYSESAGQPGLFGQLEKTMAQLDGRLQKAAKDTQISALVVEIEDLSIGLGKVHELQAAIARYRASGKRITAQLKTASTTEYLVACACDEIVMPPSGALVIPGVRAEFTFLKGLLDKIGVQADFVALGKYKSAAEPFTRATLSEASREQWNALLDDRYQALVDDIADRRKLDRDKVRGLIDEGLLSAKAAKQAGLVDRLGYDDELTQSLKKSLKADELTFVDNYGKKKVDTDFSGMTGMIKMMQLMAGVKPTGLGNRKPKIAVIYATGAITTSDGGGGLFASQAVTSQSLVKALKKAGKDERIKAIVLRVDSPGGSALASDLIWRQVVETKKPVIASMGDVAASGGYYISMGADMIFAEPATLTGSIGVVGGKMALKGLYKNLGITTEVMSRGKNSGIFSSADRFTPSERAAWQKMMEDVYDEFVTKAAEGRKMPRKKLAELAQGRVYSGRMAVENGLVDKLGTLHDAVAQAKQMAKLGKDVDVEILRMPEPKSVFDALFGVSMGRQIKAEVPLGAELAAMRKVFLQLLRDPVLMILPYEVRLK